MQRRIFLLRTGSFISAFPRTVCVRWVQALQRARGQCSFSLNAKDMVTEGHTADAKHTQNAQTLSRDSPVPSLRCLADWWDNDMPFPRLLGGRQ